MMTYPWFKRKQARHFKGIVFPNDIYNPYKEEGYSMEEFLDANANRPGRPFFLCGGWYHDEIPAAQGGGTPGYKTWPMGACDRIRSDSDAVSLADWVQEAEALEPQYEPPPYDRSLPRDPPVRCNHPRVLTTVHCSLFTVHCNPPTCPYQYECTASM